VQVVSKLLDSKTSEFTATYVGRLVSLLISKMGSNLGDSLELMLRAVLSKMQQAETLSVIQVNQFIVKLAIGKRIKLRQSPSALYFYTGFMLCASSVVDSMDSPK